MRKSLIALGLSALLLVPTTLDVQAQGARSGGREVQGREARNRNNGKMRLTRLWRGIGELEKGKSALNKAQAKKVVAIVRPWSSRPSMSATEATNLYTQISNVLTVQQKRELEKMAVSRRQNMRREGGNAQRGEGRRRDGNRGGASGRREGASAQQRQQMRQQMEQMRSFMQTVNPFYAPTGYKQFKSMPERMRRGLVRRYEASRAILVRLSKKAG